MKNLIAATLCMFIMHSTLSQDLDKTPSIGVYSGLMNYQGDLQPSSFTFNQSNPFVSLFVRQPLTGHVSLKAGVGLGKVQGDDKFNRDYLQKRNLSFYSSIKEAYAGLEVTVLPASSNNIVPYFFAGISVFHYNPYTYLNGEKVYLKPLSTEGQGLADYPERKPYSLTQASLAGSFGLRYTVSDEINLNVEFSQRKTFTDYIDDVSSSYADRQKLLAARGERAVALAFRSNELDRSNEYPLHGEQRGTPAEKDWYYMMGISAEIKMNTIKHSVLKLFKGQHDWYYKKCPRVF